MQTQKSCLLTGPLMFCKTHWKQKLHGRHCLLGRNIQRCLFSACTPALGFYFPFVQWFLKNATTQGEQYFETFSQSHWIPLLPSLQHSASSKEAAFLWWECCRKKKTTLFTGEFHTEKKGLMASPSVPCILGVIAGWFWGLCFTCSHSGIGKGRK